VGRKLDSDGTVVWQGLLFFGRRCSFALNARRDRKGKRDYIVDDEYIMFILYVLFSIAALNVVEMLGRSK
jgi:hypothetical protein